MSARTISPVAAAFFLIAGVGGQLASAQVVSLGNLFTTNGLAQSSTVSGLAGGPYNRVTFSTNWTANTFGATSMGVGINFNAGAFYNIISGLTSISGFNNNSNPSFVTASCTLSVPVSSATALTMIRAQNTLSSGFINANWDNVTLNFSYVQRPRAIPSGIVNLGVRGDTSSGFSIVPGGGGGGAGGFNPSVGLYSSEGYLLASNINAAGSSGGTQPPTGLLIGNPAGDPGLSNLAMPEGEYFIFVGGAGTTFTSDDLITSVPSGATGGTLTGGVGGGSWVDATLADGQGRWYSFTIVPTPGAASLLGGGVLLAARRRR